MNADLAQELLDELGSSLQDLETQQAALLQFLKDDGVVTEDQLAPYLKNAGSTSSVRWRAARVRLERIFATEKEKEEQLAEQQKRQAVVAQAPVQNQVQEATGSNAEDKSHAAPQQEAATANPGKEIAVARSAPETAGTQDNGAAGEPTKTSANQAKNGA